MNGTLDTEKNVKSQSFNMYRELRLRWYGKVRTIFCEAETFLCVDDLCRRLDMKSVDKFPMKRVDILGTHMEDGDRLSDLCVDEILHSKWASLRDVVAMLERQAYEAIMESRNDYAVRLAS